MTLDQLLHYFGSGLVLHAIALVDEETGEGATEAQINERISRMGVDEIIYGVATGVRMLKEESLGSEEYEPEDMFDEITQYLLERDQEEG